MHFLKATCEKLLRGTTALAIMQLTKAFLVIVNTFRLLTQFTHYRLMSYLYCDDKA